jgi:hypothetical protein
MSWYKVAQNEFDYKNELRVLWKRLIHEAKEQSGIYFDLENDTSKGNIKRIKLDAKNNLDKNYSILAEAFEAGGDWQNPVLYFRCQIAEDRYKNDKFIFIPTLKQGNSNLKKFERGYSPTDNSETETKKIDERKCWDSLKEYAEKNIKEMKRDENVLFSLTDLFLPRTECDIKK